MHKRASIALSALVSLMAVPSPAVADPVKRSLASLPVAVPAATPSLAPHPVQKGTRASAAMLRKVGSTAYPVNHLQRGLYLQQQGNLDQALIEFLKAAQENPRQVRAFYEQAVIFKQKGYRKLAQSALQQALAVKPDYHEARVLMASIYLETGDVSHAAKELIHSLGLNLDRPIPAFQLPSAPEPADALPPPRLPSIVQTPHGRLPMPHPLPLPNVFAPLNPVNQPAHEDAFGHAGQGQTQETRPHTKTAQTDGAAASGSFSVKDIGSNTSTDEALLNKLLGFSPPIGPGEQQNQKTTIVAPATPSALDKAKVPASDSTPSEPPGKIKTISATSEQAQQLLKQLKTPEKNAGDGGFNFLNPFGWFGKHEEAKPPAPMPTGSNLLKKVEEQARKKEDKKRRARKSRVASWMDSLMDDSVPSAPSVTPTGAVASPGGTIVAPQESSDSDFNPVRKLEEKPSESVKRQKESQKQEPRQKQPAPQQKQPEPKQKQSEHKFPDMGLLKRMISWVPLPVLKQSDRDDDMFVVPPVPVVPMPGAKTTAEPPGAGAIPDAGAVPGTGGLQPAPAVPTPQPTRRTRGLQSAPTVAALQPLPVAGGLRPAPLAGLQPAPPQPAVPAMVPNVVPSPVLPGDIARNSASPLDTPAQLQSQGKYSGAAAPKVPVPHRPQQVAAIEVASRPRANNGLDSILKMLPKDLAATVEEVLAPKPVEIATAGSSTASAPPVQRINTPPTPAAPSPVPNLSKDVFDNLVSSRVASSTMPEEQNVAPAPEETAVASAARAPLPMQVEETPMMAPVSEPTAPPQSQEPQRLPEQLPQQLSPRVAPKVGRLAAQGFHFVAPQLTAPRQYLMDGIDHRKQTSSSAKTKPVQHKPAAPPIPEDEYAKRMKYLLANGTTSLGPGEAFMYSEETGEGVLFLPDGNSIRRKIAAPQSHEQIVRLRRPDILNDQNDMQYNLSLMGKIIKPTTANKPATGNSEPSPGDVNINDLFGRSNGFFGWLKGVFKI